MKCFNHEDKEAVGICKVCQKGGCKECLNDTDSGIACRENCEKILKNSNMAALCMKVFGGIFFIVYLGFLMFLSTSQNVSGGLLDSISVCFLVVCLTLYMGMMNHIPGRKKKSADPGK